MEDYSEGENGTTGSEKSHHRLMYYPAPEDTVSNQFTVNAMDVEELRRLETSPSRLSFYEFSTAKLSEKVITENVSQVSEETEEA